MFKKLFGLWWIVADKIASLFESDVTRRARRDRRKVLYPNFPFKDQRSFLRRFQDKMKYFCFFLNLLISILLISGFTSCASSQKQIDILSVPVPNGFRCEEYDNSRAFWVYEDTIASDAMDWYNKLWGWEVKGQDNTKILTKDKQKFRLSFGIWTVSGSSIEITRIGKGSKLGDKVKDKKDEAIDETENEGLDKVKDTIKGAIIPW